MKMFHQCSRRIVMVSVVLVGMMAALGGMTGRVAAAESSKVRVGDPAPKLDVREFIKGEPVKEFAKGKTYVIEFWATYDAFSVMAIPKLTELQKNYKDMVFIGVSVDKDANKVKSFVAEKGGQMDYRVAIEARDGDKGRMTEAWGVQATPSAFVVNGEGKIAWLGNAQDLEAGLKHLDAGNQKPVAKPAEPKPAAPAPAPAVKPPAPEAPKPQPVAPKPAPIATPPQPVVQPAPPAPQKPAAPAPAAVQTPKPAPIATPPQPVVQPAAPAPQKSVAPAPVAAPPQQPVAPPPAVVEVTTDEESVVMPARRCRRGWRRGLRY